MPTKLNIPTKSDFAIRGSVPSSQKQSATEFNQIVAAINANYNRLMFDWNVDIIDGFQLLAGMYVFFSGAGYRITTEYNVGTPKTWNAANAEPLFPATASSLSSLEVSVAGGTINLDFADEPDREFYGDTSFGTSKTIALLNDTNARRLDFAFRITSVGATLEWPANFFMKATPQWNASTKIWTPDITGRYLAKASKYHSQDEWLLYNLELPIV